MVRIVKAHSPLGGEQLLFRSMYGTEGLSRLFEFEVELLGASASIDPKSVLGKPLALEILTSAGVRFLNGQIVRFAAIGREGSGSRYTVYSAVVRPWLWYLGHASHNRVFQNKTVVDILDEVLGAYGFALEKRLSASYRPWEYCVQYNESDLAFVSRLMELEGIYYWFSHEKSQHTLVLADDIGAHEAIPGYETIDQFALERGIADDLEVIHTWQATEEVRSGRYLVDEFNPLIPGADLSGVRIRPRENEHADYELYEWMGEYTDPAQGEHYARVRIEESQSMASRIEGRSTVRGMAPGGLFTVRNAPRATDNAQYMVVSVSYALREGGYASGDAPGSYDFDFAVQPTDTPFRAPRLTPLPHTGSQTATVVGPLGEEIWTDQYGRVKVQFHWDRDGRRNESSSCWVRVSQAWAGDGFGTVHIPRIGQEVVVGFVAGRIDRPIIMGRVYNADQMPPFGMPADATRSGIVSRSTRGGSVATANVLGFEDKAGAEQVLLHAQRNLDAEIEGDETHTTGKSRTTLIKGHESSTFEAGEERHITGGAVETIDGGETRTVHDGATETVSDGETRTIAGGATESITGGEKRTVSGGMVETVNGDVLVTINGTVLRLVSGADIRVTCTGRVEIVNAVDVELVLGPHIKIVTGPKTVWAPSMFNQSTHYTINTASFTLNATGTVINAPEQTTNSADMCWLTHFLKEGIVHQALFVIGAADSYSNKMQLARKNTLLQKTYFANVSALNLVQAKNKYKEEKIGGKTVRVKITGAAKAQSKSGLENEA